MQSKRRSADTGSLPLAWLRRSSPRLDRGDEGRPEIIVEVEILVFAPARLRVTARVFDEAPRCGGHPFGPVPAIQTKPELADDARRSVLVEGKQRLLHLLRPAQQIIRSIVHVPSGHR